MSKVSNPALSASRGVRRASLPGTALVRPLFRRMTWSALRLPTYFFVAFELAVIFTEACLLLRGYWALIGLVVAFVAIEVGVLVAVFVNGRCDPVAPPQPAPRPPQPDSRPQRPTLVIPPAGWTPGRDLP